LAAGFALGLAVLGCVRGFCFLAAMTKGWGVEMMLSAWSVSCV
jgi:hypothetical protein